MTCLEFRRAVGADPGTQAPELLAHAQECAACARYRDEIQRMDPLIHRALKVEVGPQPAPVRSEYRWLPQWAAAASVAAACLLGLLLWLSAPRETFAEQLVAHVEGEPQALVRTAEAVEAARLDEILARSGVRLKAGADKISYAMSCRFRGRDVPHLVVQSDQGPVTVLLLAQERSVKRRQVFREGGFQGIVMPAPRGAVAVLGQDAHVEQVAERFLQSVEYQPRSR